VGRTSRKPAASACSSTTPEVVYADAAKFGVPLRMHVNDAQLRNWLRERDRILDEHNKAQSEGVARASRTGNLNSLQEIATDTRRKLDAHRVGLSTIINARSAAVRRLRPYPDNAFTNSIGERVAAWFKVAQILDEEVQRRLRQTTPK